MSAEELEAEQSAAALAPAAAAAPGRARRRVHFVRTAVIGTCAGLIAVAFRYSLRFSEHCRESLLDRLHEYSAWGWAVLPVLGLLIGSAVGWATCRFAPAAAGSGIPHLKGVLLHLRTMDWRRLLPVKFVGSVFGIGSGLSLGLEGPAVQMGAATARALASLLGADPADIPQLLSAGAGAGLAAAFNAPLAGLMFVVEELHRELSSRTAAGALVGAVCATIVTQGLGGDMPSFEVRGLSSMPLHLLPLAVLVGVLAGFGGVIFNKGLTNSQVLAMRIRFLSRWSHTGFAGLIVGLAAWWLPDAVGGGHMVAQKVLTGMMDISLAGLLTLLAAKFVFTSLSYGSGGRNFRADAAAWRAAGNGCGEERGGALSFTGDSWTNACGSGDGWFFRGIGSRVADRGISRNCRSKSCNGARGCDPPLTPAGAMEWQGRFWKCNGASCAGCQSLRPHRRR